MSAWPVAQLGDVAEIQRTSVSPEAIRTGTRYVGLEHISRDGNFNDPPLVSAGELASAKFAFDDSHVLYGKLRPNLGKVARPNFNGVCSTDILPIRSGSRLERDYLHHFLRQPKVIAFAASQASGANLPRLSSGSLAKFLIPVPALVEQRRIIEILDRAETLRAQRRQALAQLDALAESIFLDMFAAATRANCPRVKVGELTKSMRTGPFGSQLLHSEFVDSGIAVLGIDNTVRNEFVWGQPRFITPTKFKQLSRYRVFPGDVLITIMGTCGRCVIVPADIPVAINTKHLCCITRDQSRCLPEYLHSALLLDPSVLYQLGVHERGAVMPGLNMQLIRDLELPLPPLEVQAQFKQQLATISSQRDLLQTSARELDALFASLQHRAFRGEL